MKEEEQDGGRRACGAESNRSKRRMDGMGTRKSRLLVAVESLSLSCVSLAILSLDVS